MLMKITLKRTASHLSATSRMMTKLATMTSITSLSLSISSSKGSRGLSRREGQALWSLGRKV